VNGRPQGRQENRRLRTTSRTPMSRNGASRTVTSRWSYTLLDLVAHRGQTSISDTF